MIEKEDWRGGAERCVGSKALFYTACAIVVKTSAGLVRPALGVALLAACSRGSKPTTAGCCEKSGPGWTDDGGGDSAAPVASLPSKPPPRFRVEDGCARDFRAS